MKSRTWSTKQIALLALVVAGVCFVLGWRCGRDEALTDAPAPAASKDVELRIDAGGVTLLPDGGLHLRPMPSLDLDAVDKQE